MNKGEGVKLTEGGVQCTVVNLRTSGQYYSGEGVYLTGVQIQPFFLFDQVSKSAHRSVCSYVIRDEVHFCGEKV